MWANPVERSRLLSIAVRCSEELGSIQLRSISLPDTAVATRVDGAASPAEPGGFRSTARATARWEKVRRTAKNNSQAERLKDIWGLPPRRPPTTAERPVGSLPSATRLSGDLPDPWLCVPVSRAGLPSREEVFAISCLSKKGASGRCAAVPLRSQ